MIDLIVERDDYINPNASKEEVDDMKQAWYGPYKYKFIIMEAQKMILSLRVAEVISEDNYNFHLKLLKDINSFDNLECYITILRDFFNTHRYCERDMII